MEAQILKEHFKLNLIYQHDDHYGLELCSSYIKLFTVFFRRLKPGKEITPWVKFCSCLQNWGRSPLRLFRDRNLWGKTALPILSVSIMSRFFFHIWQTVFFCFGRAMSSTSSFVQIGCCVFCVHVAFWFLFKYVTHILRRSRMHSLQSSTLC